MFRSHRFLALCLALLACGPSVGPGGDAAEIVGGFPISIEEAPWQVSVQDGGFHVCGGSIITDVFVLTAQHCTEGGSDLEVLAGVDRLSDVSGQLVEVVEVIPFPGFSDPTAGKDVSMLRLAQPLALDGIRMAPIAIATPDAVRLGLTDPGVTSLVSGWGALSESGPAPDDLQAVEVPLLSNADAQAAYADVNITADQLAAGLADDGSPESCEGDSGGPLVVPDIEGTGFILAGVVSWGEGCARPDAPGMYARVSEFAKFIGETVQGRGEPPPPPPPEEEGILFINEVLADPGVGNDFNNDGVASTTDDEFVEILNIGDAPIDLSGAVVSDDFGARGTLAPGSELAPGGVLLIFGGGTPTGFGDALTATFTLGLNNDGDSVTVTSSDGTALATMSYGAEGGQDQSVVREIDGEESPFVLHTEVGVEPASPGTRSDGTPF